MRSVLSFFVVVLACASLSFSDSHAGKPSGPGGRRPPRGALQLVPENVVPGPGETGSLVTTSINTGRGEVCFYTTVDQLSGFITSIGIYRGRAGETGAMVVRLCPSPIGINQLNGCVPVADKELLAEISRFPSNYFVQVNTNLYPGGAVRAQMR